MIEIQRCVEELPSSSDGEEAESAEQAELAAQAG